MSLAMLSEGWFCPSCQAFHGPHIDTCEISSGQVNFHCFICGQKGEKPFRCGRSDCRTMELVGGNVGRVALA